MFRRFRLLREYDMKKKRWMIWGALAAVEAAIAVMIARYQGLDGAQTLSMNARFLSDGCFVVGLVMTGVGLLTWVATTGFFDMLSYGVLYGVRAFVGLFGGNRKPNDQTFYNYKAAKDEKRGTAQYAILISGLVFIALSVGFLMMYYHL